MTQGMTLVRLSRGPDRFQDKFPVGIDMVYSLYGTLLWGAHIGSNNSPVHPAL